MTRRPRSAPSPGTLLLVAHGSRDPRHAATVTDLAARVRALRPGLPVTVGYLDHCAPRIDQAVDRLEGPVTALPLLLGRAFHAKSDIPGALAAAAARNPRATVRQGAVLGPSPLLLDALGRRLAEAGVRPEPGTGVVLAAAGSSDAAANTVTRQVAADLERAHGWDAVEVAHASAAPPRVADAVAALRARGARRIAVAPYLLAPGLLPDRIAAEAAAAGADALAAPLGAAPELARLLLHRYDRARADQARADRRADRLDAPISALGLSA
ncbi:sirohydrochlorin chelatase [Streptacidiphilus sp. P02-A3a]|uniref:sirohydrochlorin chelatase n=1 Tax=Streptacidiphilus sp. P02-A3a TaxID=2704468 RepID=UPI0015FCDA0D|nr:CbiX/SirB N-terminal domain-containing protein [Streptacidiphilus sp. P02-A3a]QMU68629.1 sirohydrochlorin chelatase [Streptacidiphilus sp. P02-A3a]